MSDVHIFTGSVAVTGSITSSNDILVSGHNLGRGAGFRVENTVLGFQALGRNTTATRNTAIGWYALSASTNNGNNTAIGAVSMRFNTGGTGNTAVGEGSQFSLTTGNYNSTLGQSSLGSNTNGAGNVAIGWYAGDTLGDGATANTTPDNSIYIGYSAYASQSNGQNEIVIGSGAIGHGSNSVTLGSTDITKTILRPNVGIGVIYPSASLHVSGGVIFSGSFTLHSNIKSTTISNFTPAAASGYNLFIGGGGLSASSGGGSQGSNNIGIGTDALSRLTTGYSNTGIGIGALLSLTEGNSNYAMGDSALGYLTIGAGNVGIGNTAGRLVTPSSANTGSVNSTYIGFGVRAGVHNSEFETAIGGGAIGNGSYSVTLGSTNVTKTILRANIGVGYTNPTHSLAILGNVTASAYTGSFRGDGSGLTGVVASATPGGVNTTVQFNDAGATSGSTSFTFNKTTNTVTMQGSGSTLLLVTGSRGELLKVADSGSLGTLAAFSSGSVNILEVKNTGIKITGSLDVSTSFTASLQSGYIWIGGSNNRSISISTASLGGGGGATTLGSLSDVTITAPEAGQVLVYSGSIWRNETRQLRAAFTADVANTWSNMPSAVTFFDASTAFIQKIDLSGFTQCKFLVNKLGTSGAAASKLIVRYRTTYSQTATDYSDIGTSEVSVAVNVQNTYLDTGWIPLVAAAQAEVFVTVVGSGGDGAADPIFGHIIVAFK